MVLCFDDEFSDKILGLKVLTIEAEVKNAPTSDDLWSEIVKEGDALKSKFAIADVNKRHGIAGTRRAYKTLGKDPNRYRPSAEALCRRLIKGMDLYRIDSLVDLINLISIRSGYSIGGFDVDKILGDRLCLGVGKRGENFNAIGRGLLNIECLPVYRDRIGGIGTPTSDEERTKLTLSTRNLLMCVNIYDEEMPIDIFKDMTIALLKKYASAKNIKISCYQCK